MIETKILIICSAYFIIYLLIVLVSFGEDKEQNTDDYYPLGDLHQPTSSSFEDITIHYN